jgi:hypothetical protein
MVREGDILYKGETNSHRWKATIQSKKSSFLPENIHVDIVDADTSGNSHEEEHMIDIEIVYGSAAKTFTKRLYIGRDMDIRETKVSFNPKKNKIVIRTPRKRKEVILRQQYIQDIPINWRDKKTSSAVLERQILRQSDQPSTVPESQAGAPTPSIEMWQPHYTPTPPPQRNQCYQAKVSDFPFCENYEKHGYSCAGTPSGETWCAAVDPSGDPSFCAVAKKGSILDAARGRCIIPGTDDPSEKAKKKQLASIASRAVTMKKAVQTFKSDTVAEKEVKTIVDAKGDQLSALIKDATAADVKETQYQRLAHAQLEQEVHDLEAKLQHLLTKMERTSRAMKANIPGMA